MSGLDAVYARFKTEQPFIPLEVLKGDLELGSIVFGFFIGFLLFTVWAGYRETIRARRFTAYVFMIWLEIAANITFANVLRAAVGTVLLLITVSSACIWIPAQLQINAKYIRVNSWWDRVEKSLYFCLDLALNVIFVRTVKRRLVDRGLRKYDHILLFNIRIISVSIAMDVLLISMTALRNPFVYTQFHPVTYIIKLRIEMVMSRLIVRVAQSTGIQLYDRNTEISSGTFSTMRTQPPVAVHVDTHVFTHSEAGPEVDDVDEVQPKRRRKSLMSTSSLGLDDKPVIDAGCASTVVELK
ncbi:uncharacterized protein BT62DRAFT_1003147 [Guyanagaster necrorhizus]|uniref:Uncharacterized protein n=1 Tax=Guyanagaster necrorhizus TaxID=856835 RepID=A0A9P8AUU6_9AGAR|nr:uncharacterized protein BT62DRAFT_1003147 [Guyanagaster necrorhizus MCA 3950]KAG7448431.1 hypothetical protein BT62DRAFT_1003147 [Guyanagaster necrorhizus MCA 3950]